MPMQIQVEMGVPSRVASPKASRWFPAYRERGRRVRGSGGEGVSTP